MVRRNQAGQVYYLAQREELVARNPAARIGELMRRVDRRLSSQVRDVEHWSRDEVPADLLARLVAKSPQRHLRQLWGNFEN